MYDIQLFQIITSESPCTSTNLRENNQCRNREIIKKQHIKILNMRHKMKNLRRKVQTLETKIKNDKYKKALVSLFNDDQIETLMTKKRNKNWSHETIQSALQFKFVCGRNGYDHLVEQGYPFPSLRTLRRKLQDFHFKPGIPNQMFEFLLHKKKYLEKEADLECGLVFDEMAITPKQCYNSATGSIVGNITFPNEEGRATKALVFMLVGLNNRWKHVVGYHSTGNSFRSETLKHIIFQIIEKTEEIGFHVNFLTSDMGPGNVGLWRIIGISTGRFSKIINSITHPFDSNRSLYIIGDPPHILKNLKQALVSNGTIILSNHIVIKYNLPCDKIQLKHFYELINIQNDSELVLTPKLKVDDIRCNNFNKMKVNKAKHVFSNDVSSSFLLLADENNRPEYITTAWFVKIVSKWFSLTTSRYCPLALGKKNENVYNENIDFLNEIIDIFTTLKIGAAGDFKPLQRGIVITTKSIIDLTDYLITQKNFKYVLTSRVTQDCIENLFSQIRQKNVVPNPLQFINDLKFISTAMYMKHLNNSSYENDDQEYFSGFIEYLSGKKQNNKVVHSTNTNTADIDTIPLFKNKTQNLTIIELNSLYNIAGYIVRSIMKICKTCNSCIKSVTSNTPLQYSFTKFVHFKCFKKGSLLFVNIATFKVFIMLEKMFRHYSKYFDANQIDWKNFLISKFSLVPAEHIMNCHHLFLHIIKRFVVFRLRTIKKKDDNNYCKRYDSKSMAVHTFFK